MKNRFMATVVSSVCAAICATALAADPITDAISGKTVKDPQGSTIKFARNGGLTGKVGPKQNVALEGAWTIRDGKFCRTLQKPERIAGTACQDITVHGDGTVTIVGTNGPVVWTIQ